VEDALWVRGVLVLIFLAVKEASPRPRDVKFCRTSEQICGGDLADIAGDHG
jgi:hypothetical protein